MDKKLIFLISGAVLAIIVLVVVIVVSGKKPGSSGIGGRKTTTLTIWDYNNEKASYDAIINEFQRQNNIKVVYVNKDIRTYLEDSINAIAAQNGPDVWIIPNDIMPQYKDKLVPMPAGSIANPGNKKDDIEVYKDSYPAAVSQDNIFDNQIYGIPLSAETLKIFFNGNILSSKLYEYRRTHSNDNSTDAIQLIIQNGPKNWDEFIQLIRFFTVKANGNVTFPVAAMGTSDNVSRAPDILTTMMMQNGAKMTTDDFSTATFHTQQNLFNEIKYPGTRALEFYTSFANPQSDNYTWNSNLGDSIRTFAEGKVAMMLDYPSAADKIKLINSNLAYSMFDIPQVKETTHPINFARYSTLTVPKSSKISKLAWNFILFIDNPINSSSYYSTSRKSPIKNSADGQLYTAQGWYNPDTVRVDEILRTAIKQVNEGKDAQTALDGAAGQITTLLGKLKP